MRRVCMGIMLSTSQRGKRDVSHPTTTTRTEARGPPLLDSSDEKPPPRGLHSFTSQLNQSRFGHTSVCPHV